jgi:hypothetical protein
MWLALGLLAGCVQPRAVPLNDASSSPETPDAEGAMPPGLDGGGRPGGAGGGGSSGGSGGSGGAGGSGGTPVPDGAAPGDAGPVMKDAAPFDRAANPICVPNQAQCATDTLLDVCASDGLSRTTVTCSGATPHCAAGRCEACAIDGHCASAGACKRARCDPGSHTCMVINAAAGVPCPGGGSCSASGVCRTPVSVGGYSIDATEVTRGQYGEFLQMKGNDTSGQPAVCGWNTSYVPSAAWPPLGDDAVASPVNWVDWCDALAYCKWAGKRLCGKIGGGSLTRAQYNSASLSQWHSACTAGGTKKFPYGNTFDPNACIGAAAMIFSPVPAGSTTTCQGGYPGIFDMVGNVWEWEDACDGSTGKADLCRWRGSSYYGDDGVPGMPGVFRQCDVDTSNPRDTVDSTIGFRCCSGG